MLDFYFDSDVRKRQLRRGPLAVHLDGLAAEFQRDSYAKHTARRILSIVGQFSCYARLVGVTVEEINETFVERFLRDALVTDGLFKDGPNAMRQLLRYLRKQGVISPSTPPPSHPFAATLEGYNDYLRDARGLAPTTRQGCVRSARAFVDWLRERYDQQALGRLAATDVLEFPGEPTSAAASDASSVTCTFRAPSPRTSLAQFRAFLLRGSPRCPEAFRGSKFARWSTAWTPATQTACATRRCFCCLRRWACVAARCDRSSLATSLGELAGSDFPARRCGASASSRSLPKSVALSPTTFCTGAQP
jgi:hypothetical protein